MPFAHENKALIVLCEHFGVMVGRHKLFLLVQKLRNLMMDRIPEKVGYRQRIIATNKRKIIHSIYIYIQLRDTVSRVEDVY